MYFHCNMSRFIAQIMVEIYIYVFFLSQQYIRHPNYINSRKKNDIALLEFDGDVEFTGDVHPACIQTDTNDVSGNVNVTGK